MPRQPKTARRTPNETTPRQFRLKDETLTDLDVIAAYLSARDRRDASRADAIRHAAGQVADALRKKAKKNGESA